MRECHCHEERSQLVIAASTAADGSMTMIAESVCMCVGCVLPFSNINTIRPPLLIACRRMPGAIQNLAGVGLGRIRICFKQPWRSGSKLPMRIGVCRGDTFFPSTRPNHMEHYLSCFGAFEIETTLVCQGSPVSSPPRSWSSEASACSEFCNNREPRTIHIPRRIART